MAAVSEAILSWLGAFEPGWFVEMCYHNKREWLRFLRASDEEAEEAALTVSRRIAEGILFREHDPRNGAAGFRPPGTYGMTCHRPQKGVLLHDLPGRNPDQP